VVFMCLYVYGSCGAEYENFAVKKWLLVSRGQALCPLVAWGIEPSSQDKRGGFRRTESFCPCAWKGKIRRTFDPKSWSF
jgi:hypothetical protein